MSRIGTLEQLDVSIVLKGFETYGKTGLLVVQQGVQRVEFYFRDGHLIYIGPVRTTVLLGERLLQDGVISSQALEELSLSSHVEMLTEMQLALILMERGYVSREGLRAWAAEKTVEVLRVVLGWSQGEMYFDEDVAPPHDRLLVGLSVTSLLASLVSEQHTSSSGLHYDDLLYERDNGSWEEHSLTDFGEHEDDIADSPTLFTPAHVISQAVQTANVALIEQSIFSSFQDTPTSLLIATPPSSYPSMISQPLPTPSFTPVKRVDVSALRPEMVLAPADLSMLHEQGRSITISPDQWRLLTRVDGHMTLMQACQELGMMPETICQIAAQLVAEGLIVVSYPTGELSDEPFTPSRGLVAVNRARNAADGQQVMPSYQQDTHGYAESETSLSPLPFETQSQWGNGANGATFVPGRGWLAAPQPLQPLQPSGPIATYSGRFAAVGGEY